MAISKAGSNTNTARTADRAQRTDNTSKVENKDAQPKVTDTKVVDETAKATQVTKKPAAIDDVRAARTAAAVRDKSKQAELMNKLDEQSVKGSVDAETKLKDAGAKAGVEAPKDAPPAGDVTPVTSAEARDLALASKTNVYQQADPKIMESIQAGGAGILTRGHKGPGVSDTQASLNKLGFNLKQDGLLGPRTEGALKQFQKAAGLPETGQLDAATHKALQDAKPEDFAGKIKPESLPAAASGVGADMQATGKMGGLLDFIAKGEGGYNSMNNGTRNGQIVGSTHNASSQLGKNLTDMTIGEVMAHQNSTPRRLFAAGRYQIIPETMKGIVDKAGLGPNDKFSPENQDKLARALIQHKRPYAADYIAGKHNDRQGAMLALAQEWASLPDPRTGNSYYGSGNRSSHSVSQVAAAIDAARAEYGN